eukprot:CAMPEP_0173144564 /NCGR_PEP_ID=MMETSP1105-20130129/7301_1 /TAXON_ID=2985 /ORGANISM="Ochromonas sp., Strain BG-1" /LENGTH=888 /DNA_ID=CAMNT_0014058255 /DNA_START=71 /DNA_END=2737 /DNA_ORIENTATION=-
MSSASEELLYNKKDFSSFANYDEVVSTDIKLDWTLDFENKTISGSADHVVKVLVEGTAQVHFDSRQIRLHGDILINNNKAKYTLAKEDPVLGTKITVEIPTELRAKDTLFSVHFPYSVDPNASAVQWLEPSATKGGNFPYVFTQCQAIHARSLFPCMDSPGVKTPYSARVLAPKWCTVLMSALASRNITDPQNIDSSKYNVFYWTQPVPTSPYLVALAGGNLTSLDISARVRIWSEPEVIEAAHNEFAETEEFVQAAEAITGCPYQWTRYDVVCLPPSFPYGGMENPCLTFATPTLLAGDRSLADVIAHEIAHSWTGNLVTNTVWDHFWLNEGWTVWLERKITSRFKRNDEVGRLSSEIGLVHLRESVEQQGEDNQFTQLVWPLRGEDPDDAFSSIPYEKGFNLLNYLENLVGGDNFDVFVKSYIQEFKFKSVTTGEFRDHFVQVLTNKLTGETADPAVTTSAQKKKKKKNNNNNTNTASAEISEANQQILEKLKALDWDALFLTKGFPTYPIDFKNSLSIAAKVLARHWIGIAQETNNKKFTPSKNDMLGWSSQQICLFLDQLLEFATEANFSVSFLEKLADLYGFNKTKNAEICLRWQSLGLKVGAEWIIPQVTEFITSQGRMKFVRPLYRLLRTSKVGGDIANTVFQSNKQMYHPIARKMLESDLNRLNEQEKKQKQEEVNNNSVSEQPEPVSEPVSVEPEKTIVEETPVATEAVSHGNGHHTEAPAPVVEKVEQVVETKPVAPPTVAQNDAAVVEKSVTQKVEVIDTVVVDSVEIPPAATPTPVKSESVPKSVHVEPPIAKAVEPSPAPVVATPDPLWEKSEKSTPVSTPPPTSSSSKKETKTSCGPSDSDLQVSSFQRNALYAVFFAGVTVASFYIFRSWGRR